MWNFSKKKFNFEIVTIFVKPNREKTKKSHIHQKQTKDLKLTFISQIVRENVSTTVYLLMAKKFSKVRTKEWTTFFHFTYYQHLLSFWLWHINRWTFNFVSLQLFLMLNLCVVGFVLVCSISPIVWVHLWVQFIASYHA